MCDTVQLHCTRDSGGGGGGGDCGDCRDCYNVTWGHQVMMWVQILGVVSGAFEVFGCRQRARGWDEVWDHVL